MSYIYDNLLTQLKKSIEDYYKSILFDCPNGVMNYSYVDFDRIDYISNEEKTIQLRELNIDKLLYESCDVDKINEEIQKIEDRPVKDEETGNVGEISIVTKQKSLNRYQLNINITSFDYDSFNVLFGNITKYINDEIYKLIEDIEVINIDDELNLRNTENKLMNLLFRNNVKRYGMGYYIESNDRLDINKLFIGDQEKYIIMNRDKPIIFSIDDIIYVECVSNPTMIGDVYNIQIEGNLDMISKVNDCRIINLTDDFLLSL